MIYGFRGSDIERFFKDIFARKPHVFELGQNYRSTKTIVNAAQTLIQKNVRPDEKHLFTDNSVGEKIIHVNARSQAAEAMFIASQIKKLVEAGEMKYSDAAILYRNSYLSRNIEDAFVKEHVPYRIVGGLSFYKRKEIRDLLSYIDFLNNPENLSSLERIINTPKSGLGEKSVAKVLSLSLRKYKTYAIINLKTAIDCLTEIATENSRLTKKLMPFINRITAIHEWMETEEVTPAKLLQKILTTFDYLNYLKSFDEETFEDRAKNVQEFLNVAATYLDVREFLEDFFMNTEEETDGEEEIGDVVNMMTMHASKGLEFRLVFILDADENIVPSWRCQSEKDVQEERRLFYVAMTRAKENLVICSSSMTMQSGRPRYMAPSSFINQIDEKFVVSVNI